MEIKKELLQGDIERYFEAEEEIKNGLTTLTPTELTEELLNFTKALKSVSHDKFTLLLSEFTQTLRAQATTARLHPARNNGVIVRAGCRAGIVTDLKESDVENLKAYEARDAAAEISMALSAAFDVPGE